MTPRGGAAAPWPREPENELWRTTADRVWTVRHPTDPGVLLYNGPSEADAQAIAEWSEQAQRRGQ